MATFDDIHEVQIRMDIVTDEMRKEGIFNTTLNGFILEHDPYKGFTFLSKETFPYAVEPVKMQKLLLRWQHINSIKVLPRHVDSYKKREHHQD
tara:strand:+ start:14956 stop:15234 length:279 start_codon:yes stop_codon:yes gene_type:complete